MKIFYDKVTDAAYIRFSDEEPDGIVEIEEGVNLDTTTNNRIVGIEILNISSKMAVESLLRYEVNSLLIET